MISVINRKTIPLIVGVIGLIISIVIFLHNSPFLFSKPMVSSPDGYSRLLHGVILSEYPDFNNYIWPPGNRKILSLAINLNQSSAEIMARVESWLTVPLTAVFLSLTVFQLSQSITAALFAPALLLINPISSYLSLQTLSENNWVLLSSISIYFICQKKQKFWLIGFLFWSFSQTIRYESWYFAPIIIFIFYHLHRHKKATLIFFLSSIVFPLYWLFYTKIHTGSYLTYWNEKMFQSAGGPAHIYHHLVPSFMVWYSQLINLFTPATLIIFLVSSVAFIRRNNYLFTLGVIIFFSLVAQVYFGTMEIFPARYLSLVPFVIICTITVGLSHFKRPYIVLFILLVVFIVESSLLPKRLSTITEKPQVPTIEVGNFLRFNAPKTLCNKYLFDPTDHTWAEISVLYFSQIPHEYFRLSAINQDQAYEIIDNCTFILDKGFNNILNPAMKVYLPYKIYESYHFIVASTAKKCNADPCAPQILDSVQLKE